MQGDTASRCRHCRKWFAGEEDLYCSWCGEPLTVIRLREEVLPFYPTQSGEESQGALTILNTGSRPARIKLVVPAGFKVGETGLLLDPGSREVSVPFSFRPPFTQGYSEQIVLEVQGGNTVKARILCGELPEVTVASGRLAVVEGERGPWPITLRHLGGGPAYITGVSVSSGRFEVHSAGGPLQQGAERQAELHLVGGPMARGELVDDELVIGLLNAPPQMRSIQVEALRSPRLEVGADLVQFEAVLPGRTRRRTVRLKNAGEATLTIHQIVLQGDRKRFALELQQELPFSLGRESTDITVVVQGEEPGSAEASVLLVSNDPTQSDVHIRLQANILADPPVSKDFVGIDFGTTHSCIAVARPGEKPRLLVLDDTVDDPEDQLTMPSCVWWPQQPVKGNLRDSVVGRPALIRAENPATANDTVVSIKRRMGQRYTERIRGVELTPQEIAARIFRHLLDAAEDYLGAVVQRAVVTVPANFTPPQVRATVEACRMAGLDAQIVHKHLMDEPVGAAVDYFANYAARGSEDLYALVYDFGGGTLDVSIVCSETVNGKGRIRAVTSKGDNAFGGDDLTEILRQHLRREAEQRFGGAVPADPPEKARQIANPQLREIHQTNYTRLRVMAEKMKRRLSDEQECSEGDDLVVMYGREAQKEFSSFTLTRRQYEELVSEKIQSSRKLIDRALRAAGLQEDQIPLILLVGKSSRTPLVRRMMDRWFGKDPVLHPEPKACVARGAHTKGQLALLPQADAMELLRELDRTNCRYGIIAMERLQKRFQTIVPDGVPFPASGQSQTYTVNPGNTLWVALNRGEEDRVDDNPEISHLGEVKVDEFIDQSNLPLQVEMVVEDHRNISVRVRVNGMETRYARFEEY